MFVSFRMCRWIALLPQTLAEADGFGSSIDPLEFFH
jgi:hypothetical protein